MRENLTLIPAVKASYFISWYKLVSHQMYFFHSMHHNKADLYIKSNTHAHICTCMQRWLSGEECIIHQEEGLLVWSVCGLVSKQLCVA